MLAVNEAALSILRKSIGKRMIRISSDQLTASRYEVESLTRVFHVAFFGGFNFTIKSEFFENEDGEVFQDYEMNEVGLIGTQSEYNLELSHVISIGIYGREFPTKDFIEYPAIYESVKYVKTTDDAFMFNLSDGDKVMIVLHDYFPNIACYLGSNAIERFFSNSRSKYSLHHKIGG